MQSGWSEEWDDEDDDDDANQDILPGYLSAIINQLVVDLGSVQPLVFSEQETTFTT